MSNNEPTATAGVTAILRTGVLSVLLLSLAWLFARPARIEAQTGSIRGQLVDSTSRAPIAGARIAVGATALFATSDARGNFVLNSVPAGTQELLVRHIAYGELTIRVAVGGAPLVIRLALSPSAIVLEPIEVEVLSASELVDRARSVRNDVVTREQIAALQNAYMTLADVLRHYVPTVRVRRRENYVGNQICIELRTIRDLSRDTCKSPAVYLDGARITDPTYLYGNLNLEQIERLEVIPTAEAGVRFGTGALYGALLIETRRPGAVPEQTTRGLAAFDWARDARPHPAGRAFAYALAGNLIGLGLGMAAANQCITLREPARDSIITECDTWPTVGTALAAIMLPAMGSAIGARIGGQTDMSRGRMVPAAVGAVMAIVPGYALALTAERESSDAIGVIAGGLLTVGVPLATTLADRLFRSLRD